MRPIWHGVGSWRSSRRIGWGGRNLEREWNDKLAELERLEREHATAPPWAARQVSAEERQRILALAEDLPALWHAATTTAAERKQLLRFLIQDVTLTKQERTVAVAVRWQTHACTTLEVARPRRSCDARRTAAAVVDRIGALASRHTDPQIATILNEEGLTPGMGVAFTAGKVQWVRYAYGIASGCPAAPGVCEGGQRGDGRYSVQAAAELLNVNISTVVAWCKAGRLDGVQAAPHAPWWVRLTPESIAALRKPERRRWRQRSSK
jgi:hypothetical protein